MGKHDEAWMVLKHIHDTNMRARGEPERVFTVSTHAPPHLHPFPLLQCHRWVTDQCLPLQVNRIKIPKQLDELVEMQNESANPVLKVLFKIKTELRGVWVCFCFVLVWFILISFFLYHCLYSNWVKKYFLLFNRSGRLLWDASTTQWKTTL